MCEVLIDFRRCSTYKGGKSTSMTCCSVQTRRERYVFVAVDNFEGKQSRLGITDQFEDKAPKRRL
jgi:hypothetical protein